MDFQSIFGHEKKKAAAQLAIAGLVSELSNESDDDASVGEMHSTNELMRRLKIGYGMECKFLPGLPSCPSIDFAFLHEGHYGICPLCDPSNRYWRSTLNLSDSECTELRKQFCTIKSNKLSGEQFLDHVQTGHTKTILGRGVFLYCNALYQFKAHEQGGKFVMSKGSISISTALMCNLLHFQIKEMLYKHPALVNSNDKMLHKDC